MNASTPIDLQQYTTWNEVLGRTVSSSVFLLYISLAISISEASFALIISIWLTRYERSLTKTGPTIHERIRQRHEAYTGLMEWKLPFLIEILPIVALLGLVLFALFIRYVISYSLSIIHIRIADSDYPCRKYIQSSGIPLITSSSPFPFCSCLRPRLPLSFPMLPSIRRSLISSGSSSNYFPTGPSSGLSAYALSVSPSFAYQSRCLGFSVVATSLGWSWFSSNFWSPRPSSPCVKGPEHRQKRRYQNHACLLYPPGSTFILLSLSSSPSRYRTCHLSPCMPSFSLSEESYFWLRHWAP